MKNVFRLLPLLALMALLISCQDHDLATTTVAQNDLRLNSAQESPANLSPATGTANVTYDKSTRKLTYIITYENLSGNPTMGHIHGPAPQQRGRALSVPEPSRRHIRGEKFGDRSSSTASRSS